MWQPPLQGKSQQGQSNACHQPRLLPQLDLRNRILSVHLPSQFQRPVLHSLGELLSGTSSAALLPDTSLLTVLMYRVGALPVTLLHCSVGAFRVPYLSCFFSPRSPSSLSLLSAPAWMSKTISTCPVFLLLVVSLALLREAPEQAATLDRTTVG
jgi:hypothetical protein